MIYRYTEDIDLIEFILNPKVWRYCCRNTS